MENWNNTSKRYIAFLDIMGFSNYVYRNKHELVKTRMENLHTIINETEKDLHNGSTQWKNIQNPIKTVIFSDSILIISKDDSDNSLDFILLACKLLLKKSFEKKIPMKGAISYGTITADFEKSLFFGKALIDAYTLEEQLNIYGVALDEKVERKFKNCSKLSSYCVETKISTDSGQITHNIINWFLPNSGRKEDIISEKENALNTIRKFYGSMSGKPRRYVDNTIAYIQACP